MASLRPASQRTAPHRTAPKRAQDLTPLRNAKRRTATRRTAPRRTAPEEEPLTRSIPIEDIVLDPSISPRQELHSWPHVQHLADAIRAGETLPPILLEAGTRRLVDGRHRMEAVKQVHGDHAAIQAEERNFKSEAELFLAAVRANVTHGQVYSTYDRVRCWNKLLAYGIAPEVASATLSLTVERAEKLSVRRTAQDSTGEPVALKKTASHLAGATINERQREGIRRAGGHQAVFYVRQVINLLENDIADDSNDLLWTELERLYELLGKEFD